MRRKRDGSVLSKRSLVLCRLGREKGRERRDAREVAGSPGGEDVFATTVREKRRSGWRSEAREVELALSLSADERGRDVCERVGRVCGRGRRASAGHGSRGADDRRNEARGLKLPFVAWNLLEKRKRQSGHGSARRESAPRNADEPRISTASTTSSSFASSSKRRFGLAPPPFSFPASSPSSPSPSP